MVAAWCFGAASLSAACGTCPPSPAASAVPRETAPAPSAAARVFGTEHPYSLVSADPEGRYVVLCQARKDTDGDGQIFVGQLRDEHLGDEYRPYFIEQGAGEPIDAFVDRSASGRYAAMIKSGKLVVYDAAERQSITLDTGSAPLNAPTAAEQKSLASFGNDDKLVLFLRREGTVTRAVLHDLATHQERQVAEVPGKLWRAGLSADGSWVLLLAITRDTDKNGSVELPRFVSNAATDACERPTAYDSWAADGDSPDFWLVPSQGGEPRRADDLHSAWRDHVLRRADDGALRLENAAGKSTEVVPASCGAKIVRIHRSVFLVACTGTEQERVAREQERLACFRAGAIDPRQDCGGEDSFPLWAYREGKGTPLGIDVDAPEDSDEPSEGRFLLVSSKSARSLPPPRPGSSTLGWHFSGDDFVYDVEKGSLRPLGSGRHAVASSGNKLLIAEADQLLLEDLSSGQNEPLASNGVVSHAFVAGRFAFARPFVVDLESGTLLGEHDDDILALARDGRLLVGAASSEPEGSPAAEYLERRRNSAFGYRTAPVGPVQWLAPSSRSAPSTRTAEAPR